MSFLSLPTFARAAASGAVALSALAAAATTASAATVPPSKLEYTCNFPKVGNQPLTIDISSNIPTIAKYDTLQPKFLVDAIATAGGDTGAALEAFEAYSLDGVSEARASLVYRSTGYEQKNLKVPLTVAPWARPTPFEPAVPLVFTAKGSTPAVTLDEYGKVDIRVDTIALNLSVYDVDGNPIDVTKLPGGGEIDGEPRPDSDGKWETFDVPCKLKTGTTNTIATICVNDSGLPDEACPDAPPVDHPPTRVTGLKLDSRTSTSATLSWTPSTDPDPGDTVTYDVFRGTTKVASGLSATTYTDTGLAAATAYQYTVVARDNELAAPPSDPLALTIEQANIPPSTPTGLKAGTVTQTTAAFTWNASVDVDGTVAGYNVYLNGVKINGGPVNATSYTITGLAQNVTYAVQVEAADDDGAPSAKSAAVNITTGHGDDFPPQPPTSVQSTTVTHNSVGLSWTAAIDDVGIAGYNVYRNSVKLNGAPVTGTTYTDTAGLLEVTTYSYVIEAVDTKGQTAKSSPINVTTKVHGDTSCPQGYACYDYGLKGKTTLKTLTAGNLPLTGGIKAQLKVSDGTFTADLTLANTSGRLVAAGFLPITAKVGFAPFGKTTGVLNDATATQEQSIETSSKVRIKVLEVKLFGSIPLAGGNNCQTKQLSDINLKSTNKFDPLKGGSIAGTYKISDLNGCGVLNGLVSPLTAGGGNTISLDLTKKP